MDPHAVLGLDPGASQQELQRAYRRLAKRFHPDRTGDAAGELMISINAAYDLLRDRLFEGHEAQPAPAAPSAAYGDWLDPAVREVLARELVGSLEPGEDVEEVVLTATADSHDVQLAVTDRRLLWLRDDAILGRVRSLRYRELSTAERRAPGRLRRSSELRLRAVDGRRVRFFDIAPEALERVTASVRAHAARRLV